MAYIEVNRPVVALDVDAKVAVFIDGCFWHGCPVHHRLPQANRDYWAAKVQRNIERDHRADALLRDAGWTVIRVWEHEDPAAVAARVIGIVRTGRDMTPESGLDV